MTFDKQEVKYLDFYKKDFCSSLTVSLIGHQKVRFDRPEAHDSEKYFEIYRFFLDFRHFFENATFKTLNMIQNGPNFTCRSKIGHQVMSQKTDTP